MRNPFVRQHGEESIEGDSTIDAPAIEAAGGNTETAVPVVDSKLGPVSAAFALRDMLVITYAVSPERLRPHVPEDLPLDRLPGPDGEPIAFIQTVCAFHADARWSLLPEGTGRSFHQVMHRALVRRDGRRGTFLLRTLIGSDEAKAAQRAVSRDAEFARFTVHIGGDPARNTYSRYIFRAVSDTTQAQYDIRFAPEPVAEDKPANEAPATAFPALADAATFLADRPDVYFRASAPRSGIGLLPWRYESFPEPMTGTIISARSGFWTRPPVALLSPEELLQPYSMLLMPSVTVHTGIPRYARFK